MIDVILSLPFTNTEDKTALHSQTRSLKHMIVLILINIKHHEWKTAIYLDNSGGIMNNLLR